MARKGATLGIVVRERRDGFWDLEVRTLAHPDGELYAQLDWFELVDALCGALYLEVRPDPLSPPRGAPEATDGPPELAF